MMATEMVTIGMQVEIIPVPIPYDDNGSRARLASRCYLLGRLEAQRGVILRGLADDDAGQQTADDGERNAHPVFYLE